MKVHWSHGILEDREGYIDERVIINGKTIRIWEGDWQPALQKWRRLVNQQLRHLADSLPLFGNL